MGRSKPKSEVEELMQQIKDQKSYIKHLERELKKQSRPIHQESKGSKKRQDKLIEEELDERTPKCENCCKGSIIKTNLGPREIISCSLGCGFRKVIKNEKII